MTNTPPAVAGAREIIEKRIAALTRNGPPGRDALLAEADRWTALLGDRGLWDTAPTLLTATVDDGIGQGIDLIGRVAEALGVRLVCAGLLQPPARIVAEARRIGAELVGLTVLQLDSEPILADIARGLPHKTLLLAGGPVFRIDPNLAARTGVAFVAENAAAFLRFLLDYDPDHPPQR